MTGHTTTVTLCGFAYGMNGFFVCLAGSVLGSAVVFVVLRFLFSKRLRNWSATNEKWTALETVVVSACSSFVPVEVFTRVILSSESKGSSIGDFDSGFPRAALGVCEHALRRQSLTRGSHPPPQIDQISIVDPHRRALAIRHCDVLSLS